MLRSFWGPIGSVCGLASSITASLAEANVVTGFLGKPEDPHSRVYKVGLVALTLPAMVLIAVGINAYKALIISQVVLSLQLPFTVLPLLWLVRSRTVMGDERMGPYVAVVGAVLVTILIGLNGFLVYQTIFGR